ncbi:hypothetical protein BDB00DRAFT_741001, partial [Zychaea mexicana]|uniref:uncharacterized protein n=1 Tax=Zychaea mexicana TaxID=64656 RepID=UPI0022FE4F28
FLQQLHTKISIHAQRLSSRGLSMLARGLVANFLLLSRTWHTICILQVLSSYVSSLLSIVIFLLS